MLIVGTTRHLEDLDRAYSLAEDVDVKAVAVAPAGAASSGPAYVLLDGERVDRVDELDLKPLFRLPDGGGQALAATPDGELLIGESGAHLSHAAPEPEARPEPVASFDAVPGRDGWSNPAAATPELRSLAIASSGAWFVGVHVGGLWRSDDRGASFRSVISEEADVHEVAVGPGGRVAVAAGAGLGWSDDGGESWHWTTDGLHASYCRGIAIGEDAVFVSASTGPRTSDGRLYRGAWGGDLSPCGGGLPPSFPFNLDSGCVTASGRAVAVGTADGRVFRSGDGGDQFEQVAGEMRPVRVLRFV